MAQLTHQELSNAIIAQSVKDPSFRKEFMADPTAAFNKYAGQDIGCKVYAHENTEKEMHFVLPPAIGERELSDDDLEKVAGGEVFMAAIGIAVPIAVDQTQKRHGW
jgi:hypothetical protein